MNFRLVIGYILAFSIGIICRLANIPVPAPPAILGALVVVSMTSGYVLVDLKLRKRAATQIDNCAGSKG